MNYINFNFLSKNKKNVLLQIAQFAKIILAKFVFRIITYMITTSVYIIVIQLMDIMYMILLILNSLFYAKVILYFIFLNKKKYFSEIKRK